MSTVTKFLQDQTLFSGLSDEELARIVEIMGIRQYKRNEVVFLEGDPGDSFYLVLVGEIRIYKLSPDGREKTLALIGVGDFFGEMALLDQKLRSASAETTIKTSLGVIHREHFTQLIYQYPGIALKLIVQLGERLRLANYQIESLVFKDVRERVIQFLLQYAAESDGDAPVPLKKRVTHQEIANLVGTSRETVTRILGQLQEEGYISTKGRMIYIEAISEDGKLELM